MNRGALITRLIIWSVVALMLIGVLLSGMQCSSIAWFGFPVPLRLHLNGPAQPVHEETLPLSGISTVSISFLSADVTFLPGDGDSLRVVQYASSGFPKELYFKSASTGGALTIEQQPMAGLYGWWGGTLGAQYVRVYLPASYAGELNVKTESGDVTLPDSLNLTGLTVNTSSGGLSGGNIKAGPVNLHTSSGELTIGDIDAKSYELGTASGEIRLRSLSGNGTVGTASGDIRIDSASGDATVSSASGEVDIRGFSGAGSVNTASGEIGVAVSSLTGDLSVRSTSGGLMVALPRDAAVSVRASSVSGSVHSDFPLSMSSGHAASGDTNANAQHGLSLETTSGSIRLQAE